MMNKQEISKTEEDIKKLNKSIKSIDKRISNHLNELEEKNKSSYNWAITENIIALRSFLDNIRKTKIAIFEMHVRLNTVICSEDEAEDKAEDEAEDKSETQFDIQISL